MACLVNYMDRPAPSRITPWPGNPVNEISEISMHMKALARSAGKAGRKIKACYKGEEYSFDSIREAADFMCADAKNLGRNVNNKTVPHVDGIEWIEVSGERYFKKKIQHNHRKVKAIIKGEEVIFDKVVDAMDFFMVTRMTIHSWIRGGCLRDNGVSYIGYYDGGNL